MLKSTLLFLLIVLKLLDKTRHFFETLPKGVEIVMANTRYCQRAAGEKA